MLSTKALMVLGATVFLGCSGGTGTEAGDSGAKEAASDTGGKPIDGSATSDAGVKDSGVSSDAPEVGPLECPYPAGPYGTTVGAVLDPTLQWQAYAPGATAASTLAITDLYDCDGKKGINALVFDTSGQWCVACQYEAENVPDWMSSTGADAGDWTSLGVKFVSLIIQNNAYQPATIVTASQWRAMFDLTSIVYVAADPNDTFPAEALPHNILINPRTMRIVKDLDNDPAAGTGEADPAVTELATKNAM
jgi:hypothetical protein